MADNSKLEALLEQSIQAQNRTTHAVRALATYFLIQIAWGLVAGILLVFGAGPSLVGNYLFSVLGLLCLITGFFHAFFRAMSELQLSDDQGGVSSGSSVQAFFAPTTGGLEKTEDESESDRAEHALRRKEEDDIIVQLTFKQIRAWERNGRPNLSKWVDAGRPPFLGWLQNGPF
jgi:hypothetical protein